MFFKGNITIIPSGEGQLNIYNGFDCKVFMNLSTQMNQIDHLNMINIKHTVMSPEDVVKVKFIFEPECSLVSENFELETTVIIYEKQVKWKCVNCYYFSIFNHFFDSVKYKFGISSMDKLFSKI